MTLACETELFLVYEALEEPALDLGNHQVLLDVSHQRPSPDSLVGLSARSCP